MDPVAPGGGAFFLGDEFSLLEVALLPWCVASEPPRRSPLGERSERRLSPPRAPFLAGGSARASCSKRTAASRCRRPTPTPAPRATPRAARRSAGCARGARRARRGRACARRSSTPSVSSRTTSATPRTRRRRTARRPCARPPASWRAAARARRGAARGSGRRARRGALGARAAAHPAQGAAGGSEENGRRLKPRADRDARVEFSSAAPSGLGGGPRAATRMCVFGKIERRPHRELRPRAEGGEGGGEGIEPQSNVLLRRA